MAIITGFPGSNPRLVGTADADEIYGNSLGNVSGIAGNDRIFGLAGDDLITGDGVNILASGRGGNDLIQGGDGDDVIYGDASDTLYGIGGNDTLYQNAGAGGFADITGDAETMATGSRGGNDKLYGGGTLIGDAFFDVTSVLLGNDLVNARSSTSDSSLYGDVGVADLRGTAKGGLDILDGSNFDDAIYGDAGGDLDNSSVGGKDTLRGYAGDDTLYGDGDGLLQAARGGNDLLRGGAGDDTLYGDAATLADLSDGGNDRIYGEAGNDEIWGDGELLDDATGGKDKFFFSGSFGDDQILDFRAEDGDQIILQGLTQLDVQLSIVTVVNPNDSTLITTLGDDSITLVGFTGGLTPGVDIVFA